jgi:hypothetical protein
MRILLVVVPAVLRMIWARVASIMLRVRRFARYNMPLMQPLAAPVGAAFFSWVNWSCLGSGWVLPTVGCT